MPVSLHSVLDGRGLLVVIAAPAEAAAVAPGREVPLWEPIPLPGAFPVTLVRSGVGKAAAAGATARALDAGRHGAVLSLGIAGLLPGPGPRPRVLDVVVANAVHFADEGVQTPDAFRDLAAAGFPPFLPGPDHSGGIAVPTDRRVVEALRPVAHAVGPIATVSTCSGTDALAAGVAARTGALAEAMEGAAVALVAQRLGVPFAEVRVLSNRTGDRDRQAWDLPGSLRVLAEVAARIFAG